MTSPLTNSYDYPPVEPDVSWHQVTEAISWLSLPIGVALHKRIIAVTQAQAPGPFVDALSELEGYMSALDDAKLLSFDRQRLIKDYVLRGWASWRASFAIEARG